MCATNTRRKRAYVVAHLRYIFTMPESCGPGTNMKWQRSWIALNWHIWSANFLKTYIVMITKCFYFWQGFKEFVLTYRINYQIARCRPYCIFERKLSDMMNACGCAPVQAQAHGVLYSITNQNDQWLARQSHGTTTILDSVPQPQSLPTKQHYLSEQRASALKASHLFKQYYEKKKKIEPK